MEMNEDKYLEIMKSENMDDATLGVMMFLHEYGWEAMRSFIKRHINKNDYIDDCLRVRDYQENYDIILNITTGEALFIYCYIKMYRKGDHNDTIKDARKLIEY